MDKRMEGMLALVKKKKELSGIDNSVILEVLEKQLRNLPLSSLAKRDIKLIVKNARSELRQYAGRFQNSKSDRMSLLREGNVNLLLGAHSSTSERIDFYPELKKLISELKVKSILDLGCGINPLAIASKDVEYYASDINMEDICIVNEFFRIKGIKGSAFLCDLRKIESCELPRADLCLIFKVFDVIERKGHKLAEKIMRKVGAGYFIISFSTKTLSGKPMNHPQRGWIEMLLKRIGYNFKVVKSRNEIFYLASRP